MDTSTADAIRTLRTFAIAQHEMAFVHLCTAALAGEEWAVERVLPMAEMIRDAETGEPLGDLIFDIRETDTSRPDGAIARTLLAP